MNRKKTRMIAAGLGLCLLVSTIGVGVLAAMNGFLALSGDKDTSVYADPDVLDHRVNEPNVYADPDVLDHKTNTPSVDPDTYLIRIGPPGWRTISPD